MVIAAAAGRLVAGGVVAHPVTIISAAMATLKANAWGNNRKYDDGKYDFVIAKFSLGAIHF